MNQCHYAFNIRLRCKHVMDLETCVMESVRARSSLSLCAFHCCCVSDSPNMAASSSASRELFTTGVRAVLHNWPVLQIAVDNGFGGVYGQQKADWLVDVLQQYFHDNADLQQFEVEDYISTLMDQEFDTVVDDGSLPQVCKDLLQMFCQWKQGALQQLQASIDKHSQKKERAKVTAAAPESDSGRESDSGDESMECEAAAPGVNGTCPTTSSVSVNQEDDDGWTVVRKKK